MRGNKLKIYLVGGAVRDELLGVESKDRDYVVVGSSVDEMLSLGFKKVGEQFPVFLHPKSNEEYALARREIKTGVGYKGFRFEWEGVSLEEDLFRRDLTINAIAKDLETGELIDPYSGQIDIKDKVLKHVSSHFAEDPLRVLRVARFLAKFPEFEVFSETFKLCCDISKTKEIEALSGERVWLETQKALRTMHPEVYFEFLESCGAIKKLFPQLKNLNLSLKNLKQVSNYEKDINIRFVSMIYQLETKELIEQFCSKLKLTKKLKKLAFAAQMTNKYRKSLEKFSAEDILKLVNTLGIAKKSDLYKDCMQLFKSNKLEKLPFQKQLEEISIELANLSFENCASEEIKKMKLSVIDKFSDKKKSL